MSWRERLKELAKERRRIYAIRKSFTTVRGRMRGNSKRESEIEQRKKRLREVREFSIGNEELLDIAVKNLERNGIKVKKAKTKEEALDFILKEIGDEELIVKSKSAVSKEIGLTEELSKRGIEAIETDIGDRIIQLAGEKPAHPMVPAVHLSSLEIAQIFSHYFKKEIEPDPKMIVSIVRDEIWRYIKEANIGITGANAITAEEGAILTVHNEGNILEVSTRPKKHIVLTGIDKIYPDLEEAINMIKLQTFFCTGTHMPSFINIISSPSKTADVELKLVKGIHGPEEIVLILLDNKRREIYQSDFKEILYCIGCGGCLLQCLAYQVYGMKFGYGKDLGGKGIIYSSFTEGIETAVKSGLYSCLTCGKCTKICPVSIDTPKLIRELRRKYRIRFKNATLDAFYNFMDSHIKFLLSVLNLEVVGLLAVALYSEKYSPTNEA